MSPTRQHSWTLPVYIAFFIILLLSAQVAYAEPTTESLLQLSQSKDFLYGVGTGASLGYGFSQKTTVAALKERIMVLEQDHDDKLGKLEAKLHRYETISTDVLVEKLKEDHDVT